MGYRGATRKNPDFPLPKLVKRLLVTIIPPEDLEIVLRDLVDLHQICCSKRNRVHSALWYWRQVLAFVSRYVIESSRENLANWVAQLNLVRTRLSNMETTMNSILQDLRYSIRGLLRSPSFAVVAIVTLGLGIGATTSMFSVVNGILLRPLPYEDSDRLVRVFRTADDGATTPHSGADYLDIKRESKSFAGLAGYAWRTYTVISGDTPLLMRGAVVTSDFFDVLGASAQIGRALSPAIDVPGSEQVVVLSYGMWQSRYGGDPAVLGTTIQANDRSHTIVGVMPQGVDFPDAAVFWTSSPFEVPESPVTVAEPASERGASWFQVVGEPGPD